MNLVNDKCTGCTACVAVCPKNALTIGQDNYGFYRPVLDEKLCVQCGMCEKVCPINAETWKESGQIVGTYACSNRDDYIRLNSSSGGMFYELAQVILEQKGKVYGCAWETSQVASHIVVDNIEDLSKLMKSKYVQSNVGNSFRKVKKDLEDRKWVLFSGTPCQISGLKSFLGKDYEQLLTVDFICHGAPSPKTLQIYINELEKKMGKKVNKLDFRTKENGWNALSIEIIFADDTTITEKASNNAYYRAFLSNLGLAKSCSTCLYNRLPRSSDITLGDFWGIEKINSHLTDDKGVSCVVLNSDKGQKIFNEITNKVVVQEVNIDDIIDGNPFLNGHCKMHPRSEIFMVELEKKEFSVLVETLLTPTKREIFCEIVTYKIRQISEKLQKVKKIIKGA